MLKARRHRKVSSSSCKHINQAGSRAAQSATHSHVVAEGTIVADAYAERIPLLLNRRCVLRLLQ
jgi:hypothetical protein